MQARSRHFCYALGEYHLGGTTIGARLGARVKFYALMHGLQS